MKTHKGVLFDPYRMMQLLFCVEMRALTLQWFLFPCTEMLWARTTEVRRGQRRKENSLGTEWEQARQIHWGERCHPISYCIFKQEYTGHGPFRIASLCSRRQEQSSSYLPGLKNIDAKTDEGPLSRLFVSSVYNKVWKDYIFSSKHRLSGPSDLPQFHSPALTCRS